MRTERVKLGMSVVRAAPAVASPIPPMRRPSKDYPRAPQRARRGLSPHAPLQACAPCRDFARAVAPRRVQGQA